MGNVAFGGNPNTGITAADLHLMELMNRSYNAASDNQYQNERANLADERTRTQNYAVDALNQEKISDANNWKDYATWADEAQGASDRINTVLKNYDAKSGRWSDAEYDTNGNITKPSPSANIYSALASGLKRAQARMQQLIQNNQNLQQAGQSSLTNGDLGTGTIGGVFTPPNPAQNIYNLQNNRIQPFGAGSPY